MKSVVIIQKVCRSSCFVYVLAWLQARSLFFLSLLQEELQSLSLGHLTLPILHLAETIANDLLDCRSLSDLYGLR